ncbi:MAG: transcription elongation factor Spt5 [Candidatus Nitrosocaldus sp.]|nr:transcription elongation factor Spt5 [Candidatus Nitrosocaldus sp.]MDW8276134.1 transcription elongation factor Spt5 [Candidatus Nitrosocaldus sp.]
MPESKFFIIRTTGGQEHTVARLIENRIAVKNIGILSVLVLENMKGYIVIEAIDGNALIEALSGLKHVRGQLKGEMDFKDIEGMLVKKPAVSELAIDDVVEIIGGPFKGMKARITRVDYDKQEARVVLLDAQYQLPVTIDTNYLKLLQKASQQQKAE